MSENTSAGAVRAVFVALLVVSAGSAALVTTTGTAAAAPTPIGSCGVIGTPGSYVLTTDITTNSSTCIEIRASNVTFDGNGHFIESTTFGDAGVVAARNSTRLQGVTVRNVTVLDWDRGVLFDGVDGGLLEDVEAYTNQVGVELAGTTVVEVQQSDVAGNADYGVLLAPNGAGALPEENTVYGSEIQDNPVGVVVRGGIQNRVVQNEVFENHNVGVQIDTFAGADALGTVVRDNTVTENGHGILTTGQGALVRSTEIESNYVVYNQQAGVRLEPGTVETVAVDNNVSLNENGFVVEGTVDTVLDENVARKNANWAVKTSSGPQGMNVDYLEVGSAPRRTTVSFEPFNVALGNVSSVPPDPSRYRNVSKYVRVQNTSARSNAWINVSFHYTHAELNASGVSESSLELFRYDSSWAITAGSSVNPAANVVYANVTAFGPGQTVLAPMGQ